MFSPRLLITFVAIVIMSTMVNGHRTKRVANGTVALPGQFKYLVAIINHFDYCICGGGIISLRHVLTAAHCIPVKNSKTTYSVMSGSNECNRTLSTVHRISHVMVHPGDPVENRKIDVALLVLEDIFPSYFQSETIKTIELKLPINPPKHKQITVLAGWGRLNEKTQTNIQHTINTTINLHGIGQYYYMPYEFWSKNPYADSCAGDSGSPMVSGTEIVGVLVASYCDPGYHMASVNVYNIKPWILQCMSS